MDGKGCCVSIRQSIQTTSSLGDGLDCLLPIVTLLVSLTIVKPLLDPSQQKDYPAMKRAKDDAEGAASVLRF